MNELISAETLIEQAKARKIDFGKGDPYNRLRYYTKMGWLPHMTRKIDKDGKVKGHYPKWALNQLIMIENLKARGISNEGIFKKISLKGKYNNFISMLSSPEVRNQALLYITLILVFIISLSELGLITLGKPKSNLVRIKYPGERTQIIESGTAFVPRNSNRVFIKNTSVFANSKIYISFNQDYSPANRYWVSKIENGKGFYVELDTPVFENVEFNWWLSE